MSHIQHHNVTNSAPQCHKFSTIMSQIQHHNVTNFGQLF